MIAGSATDDDSPAMAVPLFNLRNVPDDEIEEVRALLEENEVDFYETPAGNWGISNPAFWLRDESDLARARGLIDAYQQERFTRAREEYERRKAAGEARTFADVLRERPWQVVLYAAFIGFLLYVSLRPFFLF